MDKKKRFTEEDDALLAELGIEVDSSQKGLRSSREERIIAGFEEIQAFVEQHGRLPAHGEDIDIFERLYAIRLDQIRKQEECIKILKHLDHQSLLDGAYQPSTSPSANISDEELLAQLGVKDQSENSITNLTHVKTSAEKKAAEEIANRTRCVDFDQFKPRFDKVKNEIKTGHRATIRFRKDAGFTKTVLEAGQFVIIGGQIAFIAERGDSIKAPNGEEDARLRVIYDNGTESNILLRSLIRAMYKDESSRFITDISAGPLFSGEHSDDDLASGTIYVLRSFSDHPLVKQNRTIIHKIGVTGGEVKKRLGNVKFDPTFLMAEVEVVASYKLSNINRTKLEKLIHKFFSAARLEIDIKDRFGKPVKANEWFMVPLFVIDQMVDRIKEGSISNYYYEPASAELKKII